jgi:nucleotide-binding universal stress UspA family protein
MKKGAHMTTVATDVAIRRLVVAVDASACSRSVLRTAAYIAAHLGARLEGVFVEDVNLHRLAALPMGQEVSLPSAQIRTFDRRTLDREYGVLIARAESWGAEIAKSYNVRWRFDVRRGSVATELMSAAGEQDLLSMGRSGWSLAAPIQPKMGSVTRTVIGRHRFPLFVLQQEIQPRQPVFVTIDENMETQRLLTAARLAELYASPLIVLVAAADRAADAIQSQVDQLLAGSDLDVFYHRVTPQSMLRQVSNGSGGRHSTLVSRRGSGLENLPAALFLW